MSTRATARTEASAPTAWVASSALGRPSQGAPGPESAAAARDPAPVVADADPVAAAVPAAARRRVRTARGRRHGSRRPVVLSARLIRAQRGHGRGEREQFGISRAAGGLGRAHGDGRSDDRIAEALLCLLVRIDDDHRGRGQRRSERDLGRRERGDLLDERSLRGPPFARRRSNPLRTVGSRSASRQRAHRRLSCRHRPARMGLVGRIGSRGVELCDERSEGGVGRSERGFVGHARDRCQRRRGAVGRRAGAEDGGVVLSESLPP